MTRLASRARWALAIIVWPSAWLAVGVHHASICGVGFAAWTCDEPCLIAALHEFIIEVAPMTALWLAVWADSNDRRR